MGKNLSLEGLRGFASLNVFLAHFLFAFFPYLSHNIYPYPNPVAKFAFETWFVYPPFPLLYDGNSAVCVFFALSGYVLTAKYYATGDVAFIRSGAGRRYIRLAVPALASTLLVWALVSFGLMGNHLVGQIDAAGWPLEYYKTALSLPRAIFIGLVNAPLFGDGSINSPLWSLQVELFGSFLLFGTYALCRNRKWLLVAIFCVAANILSGRQPSVPYYLAILAGALLHEIEPLLKRRGIAAVLIVLGLVGCAFDYSDAFRLMAGIHLPNLLPYAADFDADKRTFWNSVGAVLLVAGIIGSTWPARALASRVPVFLGKVSFGLYLIHFPIVFSLSFWVVYFVMARGMAYLPAVFISLVTTSIVAIGSAYLFYLLVDEPATRLARFLYEFRDKRKARLSLLQGEDRVPAAVGTPDA